MGEFILTLLPPLGLLVSICGAVWVVVPDSPYLRPLIGLDPKAKRLITGWDSLILDNELSPDDPGFQEWISIYHYPKWRGMEEPFDERYKLGGTPDKLSFSQKESTVQFQYGDYGPKRPLSDLNRWMIEYLEDRHRHIGISLLIMGFFIQLLGYFR